MCLPLTVRYEAILQTQTIHLDHVPPPLVIVRVLPQTMILHNSDFRDSHEDFQTQVRGMWTCISRGAGGLVETWLTEYAICYDSINPTYLEKFYVQSDVAQI